MASNDESPSDIQGWAVKFTPFTSSVDSPFWVQYCHEKLENIQLNEDPISIQGSYGVDGPSRLQCVESSLRPESVVPNERVAMKGTLIGYNTLETFQKVNKNELLYSHFGTKFMEGDIDSLTSFLLVTFADLKNHKVVYWFGMPALLTKSGYSIQATAQNSLKDIWSADQCMSLANQIHSLRNDTLSTPGLPTFFVRSNDKCHLLGSDEANQLVSDLDNVIFGFFDPSGPTPVQSEQSMGWPMRNLVAYLSFHLDLGGKVVQILSYRPKRVRRLLPDTPGVIEDPKDDESLLLKVIVPKKEGYDWEKEGSSTPKYKAVGWELNARNKPGPRSVNLQPLLDSKHLAIQAADLNLKLMKWRMIPNLDVSLLQSTKVLLVGAGTLGCSVARTLLGWGIRKMKIVDYGKVSFSNPVRQSLFTLADCQDENGSGRSKAVAAAEALKAIAADVETEGIILSIPMPGHEESKESIEKSVSTLDALVKECDVVYLLTDTRESRWLPTLMAAAHNKMLINAALGLDSWLVMRHGGGVSTDDNVPQKSRLGCYFCNDVVAPENSTRNRTLDQQCTVTRPGLAPIASSMAVELMVSLLHHPLGLHAPPPAAGNSVFSPTVAKGEDNATSPLGVIPHQIRGSLVSYTMMTPSVPAFTCCTGCAAPVVEAYKKNTMQLVYDVCKSQDSSYLETLSGLTAFRAEAAEKMVDADDWEDDE